MLQSGTLFIGKSVLKLDRTESTNDVMLQKLKSRQEAEGWVVIANHQTRGKGAGTNSWHDEPGKNLLMSLLLKPTFIKAADQFLLNELICVSIADALKTCCGIEVKLKWPNDIYISNKKCGGVLIENALVGDIIKQSVVGIGLNLNQKDFSDMKNATSVLNETGNEFIIEEVMNEICFLIEKNYLKLKSGNVSTTKSAYLKQLFGLNEKRKFRKGVEVFEGCIRGINKTGMLQIETENGLLDFGFKEVEFLF